MTCDVSRALCGVWRVACDVLLQMSSSQPREETLPNFIKAAQKFTVDWDSISKKIQVACGVWRLACGV